MNESLLHLIQREDLKPMRADPGAPTDNFFPDYLSRTFGGGSADPLIIIIIIIVSIQISDVLFPANDLIWAKRFEAAFLHFPSKLFQLGFRGLAKDGLGETIRGGVAGPENGRGIGFGRYKFTEMFDLAWDGLLKVGSGELAIA